MKKLIILLSILYCSTWNIFGQFEKNYTIAVTKSFAVTTGVNYVDKIDTFLFTNCSYLSVNKVINSCYAQISTGLLPSSAIHYIITDSLSVVYREYSFNVPNYLYLKYTSVSTGLVELNNIYYLDNTHNKLILKTRFFYGNAVYPASCLIKYNITLIGTYN